MNQRTEPALPPPAEIPLEAAEQVGGGLRPVDFGGALAAFVLSHMML